MILAIAIAVFPLLGTMRREEHAHAASAFSGSPRHTAVGHVDAGEQLESAA